MKTAVLFVLMVLAYTPLIGAADLNPEIWKPLTSFRPSAEIQTQIVGRGVGWKVHRVEEADSYLNLDYYSIRVTQMPLLNGAALKTDVFQVFKQHLLDTKRPSAKRVEFSLHDATSVDAAGALMRLRFRPYTMASCKTLTYCSDITWLQNNAVCEKIDNAIAPLLGKGSFDDAYVVVAFSSPKELRVCAVQGGTPASAGFTESTGKHPVAGNRAFGYTPRAGGMIIYTIGADRLNGLSPAIDDYAATFGYCSAEIFWREFLNEFAEWINSNGGEAELGTAERKMLEWETAQQSKIWDASGQPDWVSSK